MVRWGEAVLFGCVLGGRLFLGRCRVVFDGPKFWLNRELDEIRFTF